MAILENRHTTAMLAASMFCVLGLTIPTASHAASAPNPSAVAAQLPVLPQPSGAQIGKSSGHPVLPNGQDGRTLRPFPILYPANAASGPSGGFIAPQEMLTRMQLFGPQATLHEFAVRSLNLRPWGQVASDDNALHLFAISPGRMVYEVRTTFAKPFQHNGITWAFGERIMVMDAETGNPLWGTIRGRIVNTFASKSRAR